MKNSDKFWLLVLIACLIVFIPLDVWKAFAFLIFVAMIVIVTISIFMQQIIFPIIEWVDIEEISPYPDIYFKYASLGWWIRVGVTKFNRWLNKF